MGDDPGIALVIVSHGGGRREQKGKHGGVGKKEALMGAAVPLLSLFRVILIPG